MQKFKFQTENTESFSRMAGGGGVVSFFNGSNIFLVNKGGCIPDHFQSQFQRTATMLCYVPPSYVKLFISMVFLFFLIRLLFTEKLVYG